MDLLVDLTDALYLLRGWVMFLNTAMESSDVRGTTRIPSSEAWEVDAGRDDDDLHCIWDWRRKITAKGGCV